MRDGKRKYGDYKVSAVALANPCIKPPSSVQQTSPPISLESQMIRFATIFGLESP